ncbi:MAG: hypothetical protein SCALA701_22300 [Candidatus Scalindua sp.]|nr:hypothetical protein [Planctomycetota bacterium]GJQ59429.1 MAG: hypothetical protein SCALA701_22300 [Candidatus Scalindua sp.]
MVVFTMLRKLLKRGIKNRDDAQYGAAEICVKSREIVTAVFLITNYSHPKKTL